MVLVHVHRFPNKQNHTRNPPKRNRRGGACVPARTSAQRRFHTKIYLRITHHARGFNDGCALAGRHGRAHRHRPYPSPPYFSMQSYTNKITIHAQSSKQNQPYTRNPPKRHQPPTCNPHKRNCSDGACVPARTSA